MSVLTVLAQSDFGTLPNTEFSGAPLADAGISFVGPLLIMGLITVAAFLFFTREITRLIPIAIGGLLVLGLLFNPTIVRSMADSASRLLPGAGAAEAAEQ